MNRKMLFTAEKSIFQVSLLNDNWIIEEFATNYHFHCLATDPKNNGRVYGGTFDHGLLISDDYGESWEPAGEGIFHTRVLSVSVSPTEFINGYHVVWAGTEPSGLFRSEDGGKTWTHFPNLLKLPSEPTWSFPPRPETHHVRSIQPDLHDENRIYVGIELGGVMKSEDQGKTWVDRKKGSQYDCHTLTMTEQAKGRVYEAAGGGFAETIDHGETWTTNNDGLNDYTYLVDVTVDPTNPNIIIASAAKSAYTAYQPDRAHSVIVRKEEDNDWQITDDGLPERDGSSVFLLASELSQNEVHTFYALNNTGIYQSKNSGRKWNKLNVNWPEKLQSKRIRSFILLNATK